MKNLSVVLNIVLLIAVAVLYYLHFSSNNLKQEAQEVNANPIENAAIVYINSDSIVANYEYIKDQQGELESKSQKLDAEYKNRAQGLQTEINNYQQNAQNLTMGQARAVEDDLMKKQQNLQLYQQSLMQELAGEEAKISQKLYEDVSEAVAEYGKSNNIHVVLKFNQGSDVLYANEGMDITSRIIEVLNKNYQSGEVEAEGDSTSTK